MARRLETLAGDHGRRARQPVFRPARVDPAPHAAVARRRGTPLSAPGNGAQPTAEIVAPHLSLFLDCRSTYRVRLLRRLLAFRCTARIASGCSPCIAGCVWLPRNKG